MPRALPAAAIVLSDGSRAASPSGTGRRRAMAHPSPHNRAVRCAEPACVRRPAAAMPGLRRFAQLRAGAVLVLLLLGAASSAGGADSPPVLAAQLGGKT